MSSIFARFAARDPEAVEGSLQLAETSHGCCRKRRLAPPPGCARRRIETRKRLFNCDKSEQLVLAGTFTATSAYFLVLTENSAIPTILPVSKSIVASKVPLPFAFAYAPVPPVRNSTPSI